MYPIADRLHALPGRRRVAEQLPGQIRHLIGLHVAARERVTEHLVGEVSRGNEQGVGVGGIGLVVDVHHGVVAHGARALGELEPPAAVGERVTEVPNRQRGLHPPGLIDGAMRSVGARDDEHDRRHGMLALELELAPNPHPHVGLRACW